MLSPDPTFIRLVRPREGGGSPSWPGVAPVLERVYRARGVSDPGELDLSLQGLSDPVTLPGLSEAVSTLMAHRAAPILVVGDYDTDGASATALAVLGLRALGWDRVHYRVPNRFRHGYGLTPALVREILEDPPALLLTVDQGTTSIEGIEQARAAGLSVVVTDHHLAGARLPPASAIVNPNLPGSRFPSRGLSGVGVLFYLLIALRSALRERQALPDEKPNLAQWLDLVALGTMADLVPLDRNNRILIAQGLRRIRVGECRPGLRALLAVSRREMERVTEEDLAFGLAPRLNAAGRLDEMGLGVECLLTEDSARALEMARRLDGINQQRRELQGVTEEEAAGVLRDGEEGDPDQLACVLYEPDWHLGILGLVASRFKERVHRPVFALALGEDGRIRGSARSIPGIHIRDLLVEMDVRKPGLFDQFGGHAMAAGLTLSRGAGIEDFKRHLQLVLEPYRALCLGDRAIRTDGELVAGDLSRETAGLLEGGGPWGSAFPRPLFDGRFVLEQVDRLTERHFRVRLRELRGGGVFTAVGFPPIPERLEPGTISHYLFYPTINRFRGTEALELRIVSQFDPDRVKLVERDKF